MSASGIEVTAAFISSPILASTANPAASLAQPPAASESEVTLTAESRDEYFLRVVGKPISDNVLGPKTLNLANAFPQESVVYPNIEIAPSPPGLPYPLSLWRWGVQGVVRNGNGIALVPDAHQDGRMWLFLNSGQPVFVRSITVNRNEGPISAWFGTVSAGQESELIQVASPERTRVIPVGREVDALYMGNANWFLSDIVLDINPVTSSQAVVDVLAIRVPQAEQAAHALTQSVDWRDRAGDIARADQVLSSLETDLDGALALFSTAETADVLANLRSRAQVAHDEWYRAAAMTPEDVVVEAPRTNTVGVTSLPLGRYSDGSIFTVNREQFAVRTGTGDGFAISEASVIPNTGNSASISFVDGAGQAILRPITAVSVRNRRFYPFGGTIEVDTPLGVQYFDLTQLGNSRTLRFASPILATTVTLRTGAAASALSSVEFLDDTPPILLPPITDDDPVETPPVWQDWQQHVLPQLVDPALEEAKEELRSVSSAITPLTLDRIDVGQRLDNANHELSDIRHSLARIDEDLISQRSTAADLRASADNAVAAFRRRKDEYYEYRDAYNVAYFDWKADPANLVKKELRDQRREAFFQIRDVYSVDRSAYLTAIDVTKRAAWEAQKTVTAAEVRRAELVERDAQLVAGIPQIEIELDDLLTREADQASRQAAAARVVAERSGLNLVRDSLFLAGNDVRYDSYEIRKTTGLPLDLLGGNVLVSTWLGPVRDTSLELLDGPNPSLQSIKSVGRLLSLDLSAATHLVTAVRLTPHTVTGVPVIVHVYRGEQEIDTVSASSGDPLLLYDAGGITGVVIEQPLNSISTIANSLLTDIYRKPNYDWLKEQVDKYLINPPEYDAYIPGYGVRAAAFFATQSHKYLWEEQVQIMREAMAGVTATPVYLREIAIEGFSDLPQVSAAPMDRFNTLTIGSLAGVDWIENDNPPQAAIELGKVGGGVGYDYLETNGAPNYVRFFSLSTGSSPFPNLYGGYDQRGAYRELPQSMYRIVGRSIIFPPNSPRFIFPNNWFDQVTPEMLRPAGERTSADNVDSLLPPSAQHILVVPKGLTNRIKDTVGFVGYIADGIPDSEYAFGNAQVYFDLVNLGLGGGEFVVKVHLGPTMTTADPVILQFTGNLAGQTGVGLTFHATPTATDFILLEVINADGHVTTGLINVPEHRPREADYRNIELSSAELRRLGYTAPKVDRVLRESNDPRIRHYREVLGSQTSSYFSLADGDVPREVVDAVIGITRLKRDPTNGERAARNLAKLFGEGTQIRDGQIYDHHGILVPGGSYYATLILDEFHNYPETQIHMDASGHVSYVPVYVAVDPDSGEVLAETQADPTVPEDQTTPTAPEVLPSTELELLLKGLQSLYGDLYLRGDWVFTSRGEVVSGAEPLVAYFKYEFPTDPSTRLRVDEFDGRLWIEESLSAGTLVSLPDGLPPATTKFGAFLVINANELADNARQAFSAEGRTAGEAVTAFVAVSANPGNVEWYLRGRSEAVGTPNSDSFATYFHQSARLTAAGATGASVYDEYGELMKWSAAGSTVRLPSSPYFAIVAGDAGRTISTYLRDTATQIIAGDFTDKHTALGTAAQVVLDFTPVGALQDLRDVAAAVKQNYDAWKDGTWTWDDGLAVGIATAGFVPGISAVTHVAKKSDGAIELIIKDTRGQVHSLLGAPGAKGPITDRLRAIQPLPGVEVWGDPNTLANHFRDHGKDFGSLTEAEYAQQASDFLQRSQASRLPTKVDTHGVIRVYDPATNTFGAYNPNGTTRTYFKPLPGVQYWNIQLGVSPWEL